MRHLTKSFNGKGAPGSQNGFDNSGQKLNYPGWHSNSTNVDRTKAIVKTLAGLFAGNTGNVPVIEPLNELVPSSPSVASVYTDDQLSCAS